MFLVIAERISLRSSLFVNLIPAAKHCLTAASQLFLEKINVIAGNKPSRSSFSTISERIKDFGPLGLSRQFPLICR